MEIGWNGRQQADEASLATFEETKTDLGAIKKSKSIITSIYHLGWRNETIFIILSSNFSAFIFYLRRRRCGYALPVHFDARAALALLVAVLKCTRAVAWHRRRPFDNVDLLPLLCVPPSPARLVPLLFQSTVLRRSGKRCDNILRLAVVSRKTRSATKQQQPLASFGGPYARALPLKVISTATSNRSDWTLTPTSRLRRRTPAPRCRAYYLRTSSFEPPSENSNRLSGRQCRKTDSEPPVPSSHTCKNFLINGKQ